jgi:thymidylate synthase ThyX
MTSSTGPLVDLISHTPYPLETMYAFWHASRTDGPTITAQEIQGACQTSRAGLPVASRFWVGDVQKAGENFHEYFDREIMAIAGLDFPLKESIQFSFMFSNVSITWREQAVRQRKAMAWSQTSRTRDLGNFADNGWYEEPRAVQENAVLHEQFTQVVLSIQDFYRSAIALGVHREDARCLQPTCQTHRIGFSYNARALEATMADRLCFIAQAELWTPVVAQMREHLMRVDPRLAVLFHPPCITGGKYRFCPVEHENERRMDGRDPMGPCPLWLMHQDQEWFRAPLPENAEAQLYRIMPLWPADIAVRVSNYVSRGQMMRTAVANLNDVF